jgi:hypothetical protein
MFFLKFLRTFVKTLYLPFCKICRVVKKLYVVVFLSVNVFGRFA